MSWPLMKLGTVVETIMGQAPPGTDCNKKNQGTIFVKAGEFGKEFPVVREWTTKPLRFAKTGDTLLCVVGATCGKVNKAIDCAIGRSVAAIRPIDGKIDKSYLFYFISSWSIKLRNMSQGAAQTVINKEMIANLKIPLPPLAEQKRIAAILDKTDSLRQKRQQAINLADDFLRSVFLDMFGDPVTNPKGWEVKTIVDLASQEKHSIKRGPFGGALKKEIFVEKGYLVYEQYHALNNDFSFGRYFINENKYQELKAFDVKGNDIIISCSGVNLGRLAIVPEGSPTGIINQALLKVKLDNSKMLNEMFVSIFTHPNFKKEFFGDVRGSGVPNFPPMSVFKQFGFIVPPIVEQQKFIAIVNKIKRFKDKVNSSLELCENNFNSLSQKSFAGDL